MCKATIDRLEDGEVTEIVSTVGENPKHMIANAIEAMNKLDESVCILETAMEMLTRTDYPSLQAIGYAFNDWTAKFNFGETFKVSIDREKLMGDESCKKGGSEWGWEGFSAPIDSKRKS